MGRVYKVHHRGWDLDLAVKRPLVATLQSQEGREAYIREAETWVNLGMHPHIVSCYYIREIDGLPCLFAECVEGGTLASWIAEGRLYSGTLDERMARILDIAIQFAWGISYAHQNGLVHQDIKPSNVMLTPEGLVKVTDFGLAQAVAIARSDAENLACTPEFASPEQLEGGAVTFATDVWSWGLCVLCMFTREVPPWGSMAPMLLEGYVESGARGEAPALPDELVEILRLCFSSVKEERPRNLADAVSVLTELYGVHGGRPYPRTRPGETTLAADGLNNKAISLIDLGFMEEAQARLEDALAADPRHLAATYNLGLARWRRGELTDEALLRILGDLRTAHPNSWEAPYLLAWGHLERGDADAARRFAAEALRMAGDNEAGLRAIEHLRQSVQQGFVLHGSCEGHGDIIRSICLTEDGAIAVTGGADSTVRMWDTGGRQQLRSLAGHRDEVTGVTIASQLLMLASCSMDGSIRIWDPQAGTVKKTLEGHRGPVRSVAISFAGLLMVSAGDDGTIRTWRGREAESRTPFAPPRFDTRRPATVPSAEGPPRLETRRPGEGPPRFDSRNLLASSSTRKLGMEWGMQHVLRGHEGPVLAVGLSRDDRYLVSAGQDGQLLLWDVESGQLLTRAETDGTPQNCVAWREDTLIVAGPGRDQMIRLYDMAEGTCLRELRGHSAPVEALGFAGSYLFSV
ncbi:MAG: WD40 repeat domain-containing serine/threonine protein kinase, partial [Candidatus Xenobia bacterium]